MRKSLILILLLLIPSFVFSNEPLVSMTQQECTKIKKLWDACFYKEIIIKNHNKGDSVFSASESQKRDCRQKYAPEMSICYGHIEPVIVNNGCFISTLKEK